MIGCWRGAVSYRQPQINLYILSLGVESGLFSFAQAETSFVSQLVVNVCFCQNICTGGHVVIRSCSDGVDQVSLERRGEGRMLSLHNKASLTANKHQLYLACSLAGACFTRLVFNNVNSLYFITMTGLFSGCC